MKRNGRQVGRGGGAASSSLSKQLVPAESVQRDAWLQIVNESSSVAAEHVVSVRKASTFVAMAGKSTSGHSMRPLTRVHVPSGSAVMSTNAVPVGIVSKIQACRSVEVSLVIVIVHVWRSPTSTRPFPFKSSTPTDLRTV